jgi:DNA invertase Pin-like site-specific DNA recombinase
MYRVVMVPSTSRRGGVAAKTASATRAAIYARVSQDKGAASVPEQRADSLEVCEENGWSVVGVYDQDDGIRSSRFSGRQRPGWRRLMDDLHADRFDMLVLWESSRGTRDPVVWFPLLAACRDRGVRIHVVVHQRTYNLAVSRDWKSLAEDGVAAGYESEVQSERIRRAMRTRAKEGRPHGRLPFGFQRSYLEEWDEEKGKRVRVVMQEPDPDTAPIVKEVVTKVANGVPLATITRDLNERHVPSPPPAEKVAKRREREGKPPSQWTRQHVRRVAANPANAGLREWRGELIEATWPAIVPPELFHAARRLLADPARKVTKPGRLKYLLSWVASCAVCGTPLAAAPRRGQPTYLCPAGAHVSALVAWMDDIVVPEVLALLADPRLLAALAEPDNGAAAEARTKVAALRARLDEARDSAALGEANGGISFVSLAHVEAKLTAEIAASEKAAEKAATPPMMREIADASGELVDRWDRLPLPTRREIISYLVDVKLDRARGRGRHGSDEVERVRVSRKVR